MILFSLLPRIVVCGRFGLKEFSTPISKRRTATMIVGKVIESIGLHDYKVLFMNGEKKTCKSCKLKIVPEDEIPSSLRASVDVEVSSLSSRSSTPNTSHVSHGSDDNLLDDESKMKLKVK